MNSTSHYDICDCSCHRHPEVPGQPPVETHLIPCCTQCHRCGLRIRRNAYRKHAQVCGQPQRPDIKP